jgi:hypothetical protein
MVKSLLDWHDKQVLASTIFSGHTQAGPDETYLDCASLTRPTQNGPHDSTPRYAGFISLTWAGPAGISTHHARFIIIGHTEAGLDNAASHRVIGSTPGPTRMPARFTTPGSSALPWSARLTDRHAIPGFTVPPELARLRYQHYAGSISPTHKSAGMLRFFSTRVHRSLRPAKILRRVIGPIQGRPGC